MKKTLSDFILSELKKDGISLAPSGEKLIRGADDPISLLLAFTHGLGWEEANAFMILASAAQQMEKELND